MKAINIHHIYRELLTKKTSPKRYYAIMRGTIYRENLYMKGITHRRLDLGASIHKKNYT